MKLHPSFFILLVFFSSGITVAQNRWDIPFENTDIQVDGILEEWDGIPAITLAPDVSGLSSEGDFGEEDVQLSIRGVRNNEYLYLAIEWYDDVWDVSQVRRRDAVWISSDGTRRDRMLFFDYLKFHLQRGDYDYTLWLSPRLNDQGPFSWHRLLVGYSAMERASSAPLVSARQHEDHVTMEVMFLWHELRLDSEDTTSLPLTLILSDSDQPGYLLDSKLKNLKWIAWQGTIHFGR